MNKPDEMDEARGEATQEVCCAILKAAGDAMKRHGDDPRNGAILSAGFAMALQQIGKHIDRRVPLTVYEMLTPEASTK